MFNDFFISRTGSQSDPFQNSIVSFHRLMEQSSQGTSTGHPPSFRLSYDGLLSLMAREMVEMLLLRFNHLGCQRSDTGCRNFYVTALVADTTPTMFDPPGHQDALEALEKHRIMQLIDLWFSVHPLSSLVSKTLLTSQVKDGTVDKALLAAILADACQAYSSAIDLDGDGADISQILFNSAATQLKHRPLSLADPATVSISTPQALILMGWRELCLGHARRATCLVGYTCRIVARLDEWWGTEGRRDSMTLNGVDIGMVEKEILQNIHWLCLSATTWAFMQINQLFSLIPDEAPRFPCLDQAVPAVARLDWATGNISTLQAQIQATRCLFTLSHITRTVAQIYTLCLNASIDYGEKQVRHINQLRHVRDHFDLYTPSLDIRALLLQTIQAVEREVTNMPSQSSLLTAYHTIVIHMLFSRGKMGSASLSISPSVLRAFCQSAAAVLSVSRQLHSPSTSLMPTQKAQAPDAANMLALGLDACSRALVYIHAQCEHGSMDGRKAILAMREQLTDYADQLHQICQGGLMLRDRSVIRPAKKRLKQVKLAFRSLDSFVTLKLSLSSGNNGSSLSPLCPDGDLSHADDRLFDSAFALDQPANLPVNSSFSAPLPDLASCDLSLMLQQLPAEILDPCFSVGDPFMGSPPGLHSLTTASIGSHRSHANLPEGEQTADAQQSLSSQLENPADLLLAHDLDGNGLNLPPAASHDDSTRSVETNGPLEQLHSSSTWFDMLTSMRDGPAASASVSLQDLELGIPFSSTAGEVDSMFTVLGGEFTEYSSSFNNS